MKTIFQTVIHFSILVGLNSFAQEVGVKVDAGKEQENTTIEIRKGDKASTAAKKKYEITEGSDQITGDHEVLAKKAKEGWKTACNDWKKEIKENNKDNKVVSISCGSMTCSKEGVESVCKSTGTYKIRVLVEE